MSFRLKCFFGHIALSLGLLATVLYLVFAVWYPAPFAEILDVWRIVWLLVAIDVIIGPLFTLLLANPKKKEVKIDLMVVLIVQFLAMGYGVYNIEKARPVWLAFNQTRFELVQKYMIVKDDVPIPENYQTSNPWGAKWVAVKLPRDDNENYERITQELETGLSSAMRSALYEPIENQSNIYHIVHKLDELSKYNTTSVIDGVMQQYPQADGWLAMIAGEQDAVVLLDSKNQRILGVVDLRPW